MMDEITYKTVNRARVALTHGEKTFVILNETKLLHYSDKHRVAPLLEAIESKPSMLMGAIVGDRIVGRAAALLCAYSNVRAVFAISISDEAIDILDKHNILATWQDTVPYIVEKDLSSRYRLDVHVKDIEDLEQAYIMIKDYEGSFR